jgi:hypothetical protein
MRRLSSAQWRDDNLPDRQDKHGVDTFHRALL